MRSDRKEAVFPRLIRELSPTVSECWAAICIAPIARTGSRHRLCAIRMRSRRRSKPTPTLLVKDALAQGAKVVVSTYNEPLITSEWAVAVFRQAREAGLLTAYVSNGNGTPQVLEYLHPWIDLYKVDLKSFDDRHYRELGGRIQPILDTIRALHRMGIWLEIVTLLIPGFNDQRRRTAEANRISGERFGRHSLARNRLSSGLQDDFARRYASGGLAARCRHWARSGIALHLCRQPPWASGEVSRILVVIVAANCDSALWLSRSKNTS